MPQTLVELQYQTIREFAAWANPFAHYRLKILAMRTENSVHSLNVSQRAG